MRRNSRGLPQGTGTPRDEDDRSMEIMDALPKPVRLLINFIDWPLHPRMFIEEVARQRMTVEQSMQYLREAEHAMTQKFCKEHGLPCPSREGLRLRQRYSPLQRPAAQRTGNRPTCGFRQSQPRPRPLALR